MVAWKEVILTYCATGITFGLIVGAKLLLHLSGTVSRKLVHICIGLVYACCLSFFTNCDSATRLLTAAIPSSFVLVFFLIAELRWPKLIINLMSRSGDPKELLKGPTLYGIAISLVTLIFFRTPSNYLAIIVLCIGDGLAEVVGTRFGRHYVKGTAGKSIEGAFGMFFASLIGCLGYELLSTRLPWSIGLLAQEKDFLRIALICLAATFVELFSTVDIKGRKQSFDNLSVPFVVAVISWLIY